MAKKSQPARKQQKNAQCRPYPKVSGANSEPIRSRLDRSWSAEEKRDESGTLNQETTFLAEPSANDSPIEDFQPKSPSLPPPSSPPPPHPDLITDLAASFQDQLQSVLSLQNVSTVTDGPKSQAQDMMNANGNHQPYRQQQPHGQRPNRNHVGDVAGPVNSIPSGPTRSHIQVAKPYVFQQAIDGCLHDLGVAQAREDNIRLAGVQWIENVRKALKLYVSHHRSLQRRWARRPGIDSWMNADELTCASRPVRTFDTAVIYYHKFRLSHADNEYSFVVSLTCCYACFQCALRPTADFAIGCCGCRSLCGMQD